MHFLDQFPPWAMLFAGGAIAQIKGLWDYVYKHTLGYIERKVTVSVTISQRISPEVYFAMCYWLNENLKAKSVNQFVVRRSTARDWFLDAGHGSFLVFSKGVMFSVLHKKESEDKLMDSYSEPKSCLTIKAWFKRSSGFLGDMIKQSSDEHSRIHSSRSEHYHFDSNDGWSKVGSCERSMDSLYFNEELILDIMSDMKLFLDSKSKYRLLGIPYRRGFMLHGPPGTGKSSLISAMGLQAGIPVFSLSVSGMSSYKFCQAVRKSAAPCILAIEDIDCLDFSKSREKGQDQDSGKGVNLSDFLNAIDGVGAKEGRLLVVTTNHPEKLDQAIVRSGRIDRKFHIDYPGEDEIMRFYERSKEILEIPSWQIFRSNLPKIATIADAQALATKGHAKETELVIAAAN